MTFNYEAEVKKHALEFKFVCIFSLSEQIVHITHPSMLAVMTKIYGVLYKQSSSIAFAETSSYWSAPKNS